ncbi:MAG: SPOR domain-containing protein [Hyphomicrobiaceae bacterium]|nr:SPOR domain-containing protein [Hyphomicrobiaceae bacterium]
MAALVWAAAPAAAQSVGPEPAAKARPAKTLGKATAAAPAQADDGARDPEKGKRAYDAGVSAYQVGRHDEAVNQLNVAVKAGGLAGPAMARALYYRGAAFHAKGMPGQAISDLTSALWFKGGLDDKERSEATRIRGDAYRAAGLDPQGNPGTLDTAPTVTATGASNWTASQLTSSSAAPQLSAVPTDSAASAPGGGTGIDLGTVMGSLFGGLSGGSKPVETSALPREAPATPPQASVSTSATANPEVLPWGAVAVPATPIEPAKPVVESKPAAKPARQAAAGPPATAPKASAGGSFRIQVGTAKSQDEANALVAKVKNNPVLAGASVSVDPMAFGGSTFYRVRVGPYASAGETRAPCSALKANGLDCLVTAQ